MKNIKRTMMICAASLFAFAAQAQFELSLSTGYWGGAFKGNVGQALEVDNDGDATRTNIYYSLGGGIPITVTAGVPLGDNIKFDFGLNLLLGSEVTIGTLQNDVSESEIMTTAQTRQVRIMTGITAISDDGIYAKGGLVLPVAGSTRGYRLFETTSGEMETRTVTMGYFSVGTYFAAGYRLEVGNDLYLFGELQALALSIKSKSMEVTEFEGFNGEDEGDLPDSQIYTEYYHELDSDANNDDNMDFDPDDPTEALSTPTSFGAWGINLGVVLTF
ncbi:hypothetical protein GYB22_00490 [bacterium]|nr:hypothetical protein [bacterium]